MSLEIGQQVPDCTFQRPDGTSVRLSDYAGRPLVLIFLRHLACMPCQAHVSEVDSRYDEIRRLGAEVLVVTFSPPERIPFFAARHAWKFPIASDADRSAYQAFDVRRGSWWKVAGPRVIAKCLALMFRGRRPEKPTKGDDLLQLGGDFVLDGQRRLIYAQRSRDSVDWPPADELIEAVRRAAAR